MVNAKDAYLSWRKDARGFSKKAFSVSEFDAQPDKNARLCFYQSENKLITVGVRNR